MFHHKSTVSSIEQNFCFACILNNVSIPAGTNKANSSIQTIGNIPPPIMNFGPRAPQQSPIGPIRHAIGRYRYSPLGTGPQTSVLPPGTDPINAANLSIFVFNLIPDIQEGELWRLFGPFGAIRDVKIIIDNETKKCKGFAFITMVNYEEAASAIQALDGYVLHDRVLQVRFKTKNT